MIKIMQNELFNCTGWITTFFAGWVNAIGWITDANFNQIITILISILSFLFLVMKIYDQFLVTRERKKANRKAKKS